MAVRIDKKITGYSVAKPEQPDTDTTADNPASEPVKAEVIHMHEKVERPEFLDGSSYKIKTPMDEHALYVTINDIVLNEGTEHERRQPFEIFINSKNMDHFQWIVALTRVMSAVFRKGGDITFLVEELQAVFDPRGGYFKKGGRFMPSLVAEIGYVVEMHMKRIGLIKDEQMSPQARQYLADKKAELVKKSEAESAGDTGDFPPSATLCKKCNTKAMVVMDGCETCLNCGYSKCG